MKKINKHIAGIIALCLVLCLVLAGCGSAKSAAHDTPSVDYYAAENSTGDFSEISTEAAVTQDSYAGTDIDAGPAGGAALSLPEDNRKVILSADLTLETKEYAATLDSLLTRVADFDGYIASREDSTLSYANNSNECYLSVRIPSDSFDKFTSGLSELANMTHFSQSSQDITDSYIETESYIASLTTQQERLLALMEQAENLSDMLDIEDRLAQVRSELQYYSSLQNSYDSLVAYSTISISLYEVVDYTVSEPTFWERMGSAISSSLSDFVDFLQNLLLTLVYLLPYLLVVAVIVLIIILLRRKAKKARIAKAASLAPQTPAKEFPSESGTQK